MIILKVLKVFYGTKKVPQCGTKKFFNDGTKRVPQ